LKLKKSSKFFVSVIRLDFCAEYFSDRNIPIYSFQIQNFR
jgi:hypothetical protein